jgi:hypothetical protein
MAYIVGKTDDQKDIIGIGLDIEVKEVKQLEDGKRTVSMVASTPSIDRDGDTIDQKGWNLSAYKTNPVILWGHDHGIPAIGRGNKFGVKGETLSFDEIEFPKEGVHPFSDMIFELMKAKFIRAGSVGFLPEKMEPRKLEDGETHHSFFPPTHFKKQELLEFSICNVGSNRDALAQHLSSKGFSDKKTEDGKSYDVDGFLKLMTATTEPEIKTVIPFKHYDLAGEDTAWDGPAQTREADVDTLKVIGTWFDSENPDVKSSYKLPHHLADEGHKTVWNGVKAAMGALLGARGGVDIPDGDRKGVYDHLKAHYDEFEKEAPEFRDYEDAEIKELLGDLEEAKTASDEVIVELSPEAQALVDKTVKEAMANMYTELEKAGAVLSKANKNKLKNAQELIGTVLAASEPAEVAGEDDPDNKSQPPEETKDSQLAAMLQGLIKAVTNMADLQKELVDSLQKKPEVVIDQPQIIDLDSIVLPKKKQEEDVLKGIDKDELRVLLEPVITESVAKAVNQVTGKVD